MAKWSDPHKSTKKERKLGGDNEKAMKSLFAIARDAWDSLKLGDVVTCQELRDLADIGPNTPHAISGVVTFLSHALRSGLAENAGTKGGLVCYKKIAERAKWRERSEDRKKRVAATGVGRQWHWERPDNMERTDEDQDLLVDDMISEDGGDFLEDSVKSSDAEIIDAEKELQQIENSLHSPDQWDVETKPDWLKREIAMSRIELSSIAGYVSFKLESGREDGFWIHVDDEEIFLEIWNRLDEESYSRDPKQLALVVLQHAHKISSDSLSLQGLLSASVALARGEASYISFREESDIRGEIHEFLSDTETSRQELEIINQHLYDIYAIIKFTSDEIDQTTSWKLIYENEQDKFDLALKQLDEQDDLRGYELRCKIEDIYENFLVDGNLSTFEWERFAICYLKDSDNSILFVDIYEEN